MQDSIDQLYEYIESRKEAATEYRNRYVRKWNATKANYWQGYLDGLAAAREQLLPLISQCMLRFDDEAESAEEDKPNRIGPIRETENLLPDNSTDDPDTEAYFVLVPCKPLVDALRRMTKFRRKSARREMMSVSFRDGILTFSMLNVSEGVPAEGVWSNDIVANSGILYNLAKVPPKEDQVVIRVSDGNLRIGSSVTPVHVG